MNWYVLYTKPKWGKVAEQLTNFGIELSIDHSSTRQTERKKWKCHF
jgi:hypothetical protein